MTMSELAGTDRLIDRTSMITAGAWQKMGCETVPPVAAYVDRSNRLTIQVYETKCADGTPWEGSLRVGFRWFKDSAPDRDVEIQRTWTWMQSWKDELWPDRIAIEIYPPHSQIVDAAPMRWLWVLPKGAQLPFHLGGDEKRLTS